MNKKNWIKPQLIVLTRGTPEESVLVHCKRIGDKSGAPSSEAQVGCDAGANENCGNCQSRSGS
jgi:hypothetical protein